MSIYPGSLLTRDVGYLPIIAAYVMRLGIVEEVNRLCRSNSDVGTGEMVLAQMLDTLSGMRPLYRLEERFGEEEVYLKDYVTVKEAIGSLEAYFRFYNERRLHQALGYQTLYQMYTGTCTQEPETWDIHSVARCTFQPFKSSILS